MESIAPGLTGETQKMVTTDDTAERWGSGLVPVFGTPSLVALMENAAVQALEAYLAPGQTSVGGRMDVQHLAPTPVGMRVHARAELKESEDDRLVFHIEAWDEVECIGQATHTRYLVDQKPFITRAEKKSD